MTTARPDIAIFLLWVGPGGKETVVWHLARAFVDAGYRVDLVLANADSEYRDRIPSCVRVVDLKTHGYLRSTLKLALYLRRHRPRALFSTLPFAALPAIVARRLSFSSCRVVVRVCNNLRRRFEHEAAAFPRHVRRGLRTLPHRADAVVACSAGIADEFAEITSIDRDRIHVIYNPAISAAIAARAAEPVDHPWFAEPGPPIVLGVGRLARQKNFPLLIDAFAAVRRDTDARLVILGEGPERPHLERRIAEHGLADAVSLPGHVANPYAWMARAAVFVLSSSWEGFANVIAEALAVGTPVVATDCPSGPAEVLDGGEHGLLVPMDDAAAMADAIRRALDGGAPPPDDQWLRRFTVDDVAGRFLELLGLPLEAPRAETTS